MGQAQLVDEVLAEIKLPLEMIKGNLMVKGASGNIGIARYITRNMKYSDKLKDSEIRDLADAVTAKFADVSLWFPKTVQDYVDLYSKGPLSCMTNPPGNGNGYEYCPPICKEIFEKHGLWSSILYYYIPEIQFAALMVGDDIVCRASIYNDKAFDYPYYSKHKIQYRDELTAQLKKTGLELRQIDSMKCWVPTYEKEFSIEGIETSMGMAAPWPHIDFSLPHYVVYDKKNNLFMFSPMQKPKWSKAGYTRSLHQWMLAKDINHL